LILRSNHSRSLKEKSEAYADAKQTSHNEKPDQGSRTIHFHVLPSINFLSLQAAARP
jgi:hypothetical protein